MKQIARIGALLTVAAFAALPSRAGLIALDSSFGPDTLIEDTSTHLEWLKLTLTEDQSFNAISSQLGPGGEFAGFRYGNVVEVGQLFQDAGIPSLVPSDTSPWGNIYITQNPGVVLAATDLNNLFGSNSFGGTTGNSGIIGNHDLGGAGPDEIDIAGFSVQTGFACSAMPCATVEPLTAFTFGGPAVLDTAFPDTGSFLVRSASSTIPEPGTIILLSTGLILLAGAKALRKRHTIS